MEKEKKKSIFPSCAVLFSVKHGQKGKEQESNNKPYLPRLSTRPTTLLGLDFRFFVLFVCFSVYNYCNLDLEEGATFWQDSLLCQDFAFSWSA